MVKYGESYLSSNFSIQFSTKVNYVVSTDISLSAKLRVTSFINPNFIEIDLTNFNTNFEVNALINTIEQEIYANLICYSNISFQNENRIQGSSSMISSFQISLKDFFANIWPIGLTSNYIEGHVIRYEITDGFVYNEDLHSYNKFKILYTFTVPKVLNSDLNIETTSFIEGNRIRFGPSEIFSQFIQEAVAYEFSKAQAEIFSQFIQEAVAYEFSKAQAELSSLTNIFAISNYKPYFKSDIFSEFAISPNIRRVRNISPTVLAFISQSNCLSAAIRSVNSNLLSNIITSSYVNYKTTVSISMTSNSSLNATPRQPIRSPLSFTVNATSTKKNTNAYEIYCKGSWVINYGDGTSSTFSNTQRLSKVYNTPGDYTITITPADEIQHVSINATGKNTTTYPNIVNLKTVNSWGEIVPHDMVMSSTTGFAFVQFDQFCSNEPLLTSVPNYHPQRWLFEFFKNCTSFNNYNISYWFQDEPVELLLNTFQGCTLFNVPIGSWKIGPYDGTGFRDTPLSGAFSGTPFNQSLSGWDMSQITNIRGLFNNATQFNNNSISNWDVSNVTTMVGLFNGSTNFNQPLNNWNTSKVTDMQDVFLNATSFNQPLNNWNTSKVTNMFRMFSNATSFNQPLNNWDTSKVTNMGSMFNNADAFDQDISNWCVTLIPTKPTLFDNSTSVNWTTSEKPVWGTCPP